jgi:hypothetical protein
MWICWGFLFHMDFGIFAIWLWLLPMVYVRAEHTHRWYHRVFKAAYPKRRTSFIPFIDMAGALAAVTASQEYGS